jgi:hypothetical protein
MRRLIVMIVATFVFAVFVVFEVAHYSELIDHLIPKWVDSMITEKTALVAVIASTLVVVFVWAEYIFENHKEGNDRDGDPSKLHVFHAYYAWGNRFWQRKDVTRKVRSSIRNNSVDVPASYKFFGDPKPGKSKWFVVKYSYLGFTRTIDYFPEDYPKWPSRLVLPTRELREELERMLKEFPEKKT